MRNVRRGFMAAMVLAALTHSVHAGVVNYTDKGSYLAAAGAQVTIDFTGLPDQTVVTTQYAGLGATFTDGDDLILIYPVFEDNAGLESDGSTEIAFSSPLTSIGADFPGGLHFDLFRGSLLIGSSADFAGVGLGHFGGVISDVAFDRVVVSDYVDQKAFIDALYFGGRAAAVPEPSTIAGAALAGVGGLIVLARRRKTSSA